MRQKQKDKRAPGQADKEERKQRLQTHGRSSMTRGIAHALVLKEGDLFFLCEPDGSVPLRGEHGCGLYYHDCRFLDGYEWQFGGVKPDMLASTATSGVFSSKSF